MAELELDKKTPSELFSRLRMLIDELEPSKHDSDEWSRRQAAEGSTNVEGR